MASFAYWDFTVAQANKTQHQKLQTTKKKSKILSIIASFLNSCFTGGEILHVMILMLGARLTTGSSMRISCPHWETDWRESRWLKCKKKKGNRSNSCWELLLQGGETRWWCLRAWNLASVGRLVAPALDESALGIPPAHTFSQCFGWALPQSIFNSYTFHD